ncbi:hypothetical protein C0992_011923 [Termitomyces sp. T32_za158]|nr:hypothetical protein C0992_011923 [Termitomyces sp. T32_za158]
MAPKSGITRPAIKGPLQDITDRFNPARSSANSSTPNPRHKPNPLRTTCAPIVSTSLPPSSPPSASSRLLVDHAQHVSPSVLSGNLELESDDPGRRDTTAASDANSDADPFGFFALENKLKIFRSRQQHTKLRNKPAPSPRIQAVYSDCVNPPTSTERHNERTDIESPISFGKDNSEPDPMPSTPLNPIVRKGKERAVAKEKSIPRVELAENILETPAPSQKANRRRRNAKGVSDLPSGRSSLRQTGATAKARKNASRVRTREEGGCVSPAGLLMKTTRQNSHVKKTAKPTSSDAHADAKERQARLDYFKKLEDYQLEKENVYVI